MPKIRILLATILLLSFLLLPPAEKYDSYLDTLSHASMTLKGQAPYADVAQDFYGFRALLTNQELERAALQLPGFAIARAEVLPRFDRRMPERSIAGVRTLIAIPYRTAGSAEASTHSAYFAAIQRSLEERRVLGERLIPAKIISTLFRRTICLGLADQHHQSLKNPPRLV